MLWTLFLLVPGFLLLAALVRTRLENNRKYHDIRIRREAGIGVHLDDATLRHNIYGTWLYARLFGITFAIGRYFGNCFWPALVLTKDRRSPLTLTVRTGPGLETTFCLGRLTTPPFGLDASGKLVRNEKRTTTWLPRLWWHSTHVARRFGTAREAPHGTIWQYRGWLGNHVDC
jgi:hypothetical protein